MAEFSYKRKLRQWTTLLVIVWIPDLALALCNYPAPNHKSCTYYAASISEAHDICEQKSDILVNQGYQHLPCVTSILQTVGSGWYARDSNGMVKTPFHFIRVEAVDSCQDNEVDPDTGQCLYFPDKDDGGGCNGIGNPCIPSTGNKFQQEKDIQGVIHFTRSYNSRTLLDIGLGKGWRSNLQAALRIGADGDSLILISGMGRGEPWTKAANTWSGDIDSDFSIVQTESGFTVTAEDDSKQSYNASGRLLFEQDNNGNETQYSYNVSGQLISVSNHFGHTLTLSWNADSHIASIATPVGDIYTYAYDAMDNLISVTYPDGRTRQYHYESSDFPNHLTGITDENGDRMASYAYDSEGRAIVTEHADIGGGTGQEQFQIDYND